MTGNSALTVTKELIVESNANVTFTGGRIVSSGSVSHPNLLAANQGTVIESTLNGANAFAPFTETTAEWVLHGGSVVNTSGNSSDGWNRLDFMGLTNSTRTITGTGLLKIGRFYTKESSNIVIRLNGPGVYLHELSKSGHGTDIEIQVGGGSTLGTWGTSSPTLQYLKTTFKGDASIDTTNYGDGVSPASIKVSELGECDGVLTVKGVGTSTWTKKVSQPSLGVSVIDSATLAFSSGVPVNSLADIILTDSGKMTTPYYLGRKGNASEVVKSLTMDVNSSLEVGRYMRISGDAVLSRNARAVIRNASSDANPAFECANLSLADDASLVVTGQIAAATLSMSGNAHLEFTAGSSFTAGSTFGDGNWTMSITIPSDYEAGIHPIVKGVEFDDDFADHVTITGATEGWSVKVLDGTPALCKDAVPEGLEWTGNSESSQNWSDAANWNGGTLPTSDDKIAFGGTKGLEPFDNDYLTSVSGIVFRASAGPFVVTGSVDSLTMTGDFPNGSRSNITPDNAVILSLSAFDQEIALPVSFTGNAALLAMSGGSITLSRGINTAAYKWFVVGGEVCLGGESAADYLAFNSKYTTMPSTLRLLPGATFTARRQGYRSFTDEANFVGRFIIEEGATMNVVDGDCSSWNGGLEYVVNGTLKVYGKQDTGRLTASSVDQFYAGSGEIYADSARSARFDSTSKYINFGGTLKLYMDGNWYTATYKVDGGNVMQNPNYPTRFRMTDGTTLGATKDWTYGPRDTAYDTIANKLTPAQRASIMTGTVTVNTQSPKDDAAHTITFVDPLNAADATIVKAGAGTLRFNEPEGYKSQIGNLTVSAGGVSFAAAPTLSGTLTLASTGAEFEVDGKGLAPTWDLVATAENIVGPGGQTSWNSAGESRRFKIVSEGAVKKLYSSHASGLTIIFR